MVRGSENPITDYESIFNINYDNYTLHAYAQNYYSQVVTLTPQTSGTFKIELESVFDNYLYVIDPTTSSANVNDIDYNDDGAGDYNALITRDLVAGRRYFIVYCQYNCSTSFTNLDEGDDLILKISKIS